MFIAQSTFTAHGRIRRNGGGGGVPVAQSDSYDYSGVAIVRCQQQLQKKQQIRIRGHAAAAATADAVCSIIHVLLTILNRTIAGYQYKQQQQRQCPFEPIVCT